MEKRKSGAGRSETATTGGSGTTPGVTTGSSGISTGSSAAAAAGTEGASTSAPAFDRTGGSVGTSAPSGAPKSDRASGIVHTVQQKATEQLSSQKGRATDGLDAIAHAIRESTGQLRRDQHDTVARYVDRAAEQLERLSGALRAKDVNELLHDAQRLARRQPALFIGGSFAFGLLAARFLKSSPRDADGFDGAHIPPSGASGGSRREAY